jgi:hypothetical protein
LTTTASFIVVVAILIVGAIARNVVGGRADLDRLRRRERRRGDS